MQRFKILAAAICLAPLAGCVVSGPGLSDMVDDTMITGSVKPAPVPEDQLSDERIIRNAVSAADLEKGDGRYPWSNPETGASGVIAKLAEERSGTRICRRFETSRQRFDGVNLYDGEACTAGPGQWVLVDFARRTS
ncbi:RT0821/Lpp0805 family surface protein [Jiella sp. M17.18]|uniref:RT0821/Lpp0805 family surface protein n=1 Tax=Jiella sp. M17.18 TaxID=3234247 RepID=UPI0034DF7569